MAKRRVPLSPAHPGARLAQALHQELDDLERRPIEPLDGEALMRRLKELEALRAQAEEASVVLLTALVLEAAAGLPGFKPT